MRTMTDGSASRRYLVPDNMCSDLPEATEVSVALPVDSVWLCGIENLFRSVELRQ